MKENPILFSTEMVRAILDGRKTQTRRICRFEALDSWEIDCLVRNGVYFRIKDRPDIPSKRVDFPYGEVGDRLWVRESYTTQMGDSGYARGRYTAGADWFTAPNKKLKHPTKKLGMVKIPSIHMPKWAARIWLEITNIRVERVQDISGEDAQKEGWPRDQEMFPTINTHYKAKHWFQCLCNSLNPKRGYGWDKNPWVWVIEFKKL